jgi:hypothetical protein
VADPFVEGEEVCDAKLVGDVKPGGGEPVNRKWVLVSRYLGRRLWVEAIEKASLVDTEKHCLALDPAAKAHAL